MMARHMPAALKSSRRGLGPASSSLHTSQAPAARTPPRDATAGKAHLASRGSPEVTATQRAVEGPRDPILLATVTFLCAQLRGR